MHAFVISVLSYIAASAFATTVEEAALLSRWKRQFHHLSPEQTVELNFSVPFIFSARLYPYGAAQGDARLPVDQTIYPLALRHGLSFFGETHDTIYILKDGAVAFSDSVPNDREAFPHGPRIIAPYWAPTALGKHGAVFFRETTDENVISLAASEVEIQYRYSESFRPKAVTVITWENVAHASESDDLPVNDRNTYQLALVQSDNGTFAHFVYSKLRWHSNAVAGLNEGNGYGFFTLPGSGSPHAVRLANLSDIGIPGEWIFKIDETQMYLCGPGFKGTECTQKCDQGEWYYDCSRSCHCGDARPCNIVNGQCAVGACADGWGNPPTCDIDIDECEGELCDGNTPDCINTPGSYICTCLSGYDNLTNTCRGSEVGQRIEVIPQQPSVLFVGDTVPNSNGIVVVPGSAPPPPPGAAASAEDNGLTTRRRPTFPASSPNHSAHWTSSGAAFPIGPTVTTWSERPELLAEGPVDNSQPASLFPLPQPSPTASGEAGLPLFLPPTTRFASQRPATVCNRQCPDNAECVIAGGLETCACQQGYSGDGLFCADINECFNKTSCSENAECENTLGSFKCICQEGFVSENTLCIDIDECATGTADCPGRNTSQCVNTNGGFECRCRTGYNGNPSSILGCIDINECLIPEFYCGPNANCDNTEGGYVCTCFEGYERDATSSVCIDIDECTHQPCDRAAQCTNTAGSFICRCHDGFSGDGFHCQETILFPFSQDEEHLPIRRDSFLEIQLERPITFLGQQFRRLFVSGHGIISLDAPLTTFADRPIRQIPLMGLAPLYEPVDLTEGGGVFVKQTTDRNTLARSELTVQDHFNEPDFTAESAVIVTFHDVKRAGAPNNERNTYQVVLSSGEQGTYATFVYDQLHSNTAKLGILATDSRFSVTLPGSGDGSKEMAAESNMGKTGKWMFRVDLPQIITCPAGYTGPPYCLQACASGYWGTNCTLPCRCAEHDPCDHLNGSCPNGACLEGYMNFNCYTDIDECALGLARCHASANCLNYAGSYGCECKPGFLGDGVECAPDNACQRSGLQCSLDAVCITSQDAAPLCQCRDGYEGNGIECDAPATPSQAPAQFASSSAASTPPQFADTSTQFVTAWHSVRPDVGRGGSPPFHPFTPTPAPAAGVDGNRVVDAVSKGRPPGEPKPSIIAELDPGSGASSSSRETLPPLPSRGPEIENEINSAIGDRHRQPQRSDASVPPTLKPSGKTTSSALLVIVIPAVLCGIWLLLIIVLLIVCLRKRKQRQKEKYGVGYFSQTGSVKGSQNGAYYGSSQCSMPRMPYDYYQGGYASDPYAPYRY